MHAHCADAQCFQALKNILDIVFEARTCACLCLITKPYMSRFEFLKFLYHWNKVHLRVFVSILNIYTYACLFLYTSYINLLWIIFILFIFHFFLTILFIHDKCREITLFNAHILIRLKIVMFGIYDEYQSYIKHLKILILILSLFKYNHY